MEEELALHGGWEDDLGEEFLEQVHGTGRQTHECILDLHTALVGFRGGRDIKVPDQCCNDDSEHHVSQVHPSTLATSCPEWHQVLRHLFGGVWSLEPSFGDETIWRGKDGRITVHRPALRSNYGPGRQGITH